VLCFLSAGLSIYISYTARDFNTALTEKNQEGFYAGILKFVFGPGRPGVVKRPSRFPM